MDYKVAQGPFAGEEYVHCLYCGDGFTVVYIYKNLLIVHFKHM